MTMSHPLKRFRHIFPLSIVKTCFLRIYAFLLNSLYTCLKFTCKKPTTISLIFHCHGSKESTCRQFLLVIQSTTIFESRRTHKFAI